MAEVAKYPLNDVFKLIREDKYWFSAKSRSIDPVINIYKVSNDEAQKFILEGVMTLTPQNFYKRGMQWGVVVDIYGLIYDGKPWYVKFAITKEDEEGAELELQEISFHPPEEEFVTTGGITIPTEIKDESK